MKRHPALLLLSAGLLIPAAAMVAAEPPSCRLQVIPDYTLGITYRAVLRLAPQCDLGTTLRARKSSTLNVRRNGAPYQPIKPTQGAWDVGAKTTVPSRELWTLSSWRWEYYDPEAWNPRLGQKGRWLAAEVLHAAP